MIKRAPNTAEPVFQSGGELGVTVLDGHLHLPDKSRLAGDTLSATARNGRAAVFLDRDGVIVEDVHFLTEPAQLRVLPTVAGALKLLQEHFWLIVVTNQSGIARGFLSESNLAVIHSRLVYLLALEGSVIDALYYCPHLPGAAISDYDRVCDCRKPKPGMLARAQKDWGIDPARSYLLGDKSRDVAAGQAAGVTSILLGGKGDGLGPKTLWAADMAQAARMILARDQEVPGAVKGEVES